MGQRPPTINIEISIGEGLARPSQTNTSVCLESKRPYKDNGPETFHNRHCNLNRQQTCPRILSETNMKIVC